MSFPFSITLEEDIWPHRRKQNHQDFNPFDLPPANDLLTPAKAPLRRYTGLNQQALAAAVPPPPPITHTEPSPPPLPATPPPIPAPAQPPPVSLQQSQNKQDINPLGLPSPDDLVQPINAMGPRLPGLNQQTAAWAVPPTNLPPAQPPPAPFQQQQPPSAQTTTVKITPQDVAWTRMWLVRHGGMHPGAAALLAPLAAPSLRYGVPMAPETLALFQPPEMAYVTYHRGRPIQWQSGGYTWAPMAMKRADMAKHGMDLAVAQQQAALGAIGSQQQATAQAEAQNMQNRLATSGSLPQLTLGGLAKQEPPALQAPVSPAPSVAQAAFGESAERAQTQTAQMNAQQALQRALGVIAQLPDVQNNPELLKQIQQVLAGLQAVVGKP